jgi:uncharacterized membrane protein YciS (DUF1049 family)
MAGELRAPLVTVEPLAEGNSTIRSSLVITEPLTEGSPNLEANFVFNEALSEGVRNLRVSFLFMECLIPIPVEEYMSTTPFPGFGNSQANPAIPAGLDPFNTVLPGLDITVHKKPAMRTRIAEASGGQEDRNALWDMPRWDFELSYNFLEDRTGVNSSLKTVEGFFLSMGASFDSWLFKDPDDYLVTGGLMGVTDGVTTQFYFHRPIGAFNEIVGQVDTVNTVTLYLAGPEDHTVPVSPGPYTVTVSHAATFIQDLGVTKAGTPLTKVVGAPANNQYAVDTLTGIYTFNSAQNNQAVVISYQYSVASGDYTVTMPNYVVFGTSPITGWTLTADFQFYFVCRFTEDMLDFEKFADKWWNLQTCDFRSLV